MSLAAAWAEKRRAAGMVALMSVALAEAQPTIVAQPPAPPVRESDRAVATDAQPSNPPPASATKTSSSLVERRTPKPESEPKKRRVSHRDISLDQELDLIRQYQAGNRQAGATLLQMHEPLIYKTVKRYFNKGLEVDDVLQVGRIGFLTGVKNFDPSRGTRLTTYATTWVAHEAGRALQSTGSTIRLPFHIHEKVYKALKGGKRLTDELSSAWSVRLVHDLDAPLGENRRRETSHTTFGDVAADPGPSPESLVAEAHDQEHLKNALHRAMSVLTDQERDVIQRRMLADEPEALAEIAATYGLSRERIRQIEAKALQKLGESMKRASAAA